MIDASVAPYAGDPAPAVPVTPVVPAAPAVSGRPEPEGADFTTVFDIMGRIFSAV
ncbi:hypothetical protein J8N05_07725 [Streptomyces sp. BH-SS-21]|uniref:Uncharacterized protein n=1 Tax=Streptomyces liliiviolaceus TaxID=2823109 RepID=A0A940XWZ0_9ACTN|nr:hypothetical protein [Streptomyces liliiviolaceus]MBQ0848100.1 hypothetical protein [Streptomyces liliiviolaceus]